MISDHDRMQMIDDIVAFRLPLDSARRRLQEVSFDYKGKPYTLTAKAVMEAIGRFEEGVISANDLHEWADLIEVREDIQADSSDPELNDWILRTILMLANPELCAEDTAAMITGIKADYDKVVSKA